MGSLDNCDGSGATTIRSSIRNDVTDIINSQVKDELNSRLRAKYVGQLERFPATSCREILNLSPDASSGDYWIINQAGVTFQAYCNMDLACGPDSVRGWMRVANVNLSDSSQNCPPGNFHLSTTDSIRYCLQNNVGFGCDNSIFSVNQVPYARVCGRATGIQIGTVDGFLDGANPMRPISTVYLDGISLTYGFPRNHIWSFAAAISEMFTTCPCSTDSTDRAPGYVGSDYFCESGSPSGTVPGNMDFPDDPLWDGELCRNVETPCCGNPNFNPPWFYRDLGGSRTDGIEMRLCKDQHVSEEQVGLRELELYIQ